MILGIGSDIVENLRISKLYKNYGNKFLNRIYTTEEIEYALSHSNPIPYLSSRFAVKEAAIKTLNLQKFVGITWKDIEVRGKSFGKKKLAFHNKAKLIVEGMQANRHHVTLSHSDKFSVAFVILEKS